MDKDVRKDEKAREECNRSFQCGEVTVNIKYAPEGKKLRERLADYLTALVNRS